jgi:hypothetical protein
MKIFGTALAFIFFLRPVWAQNDVPPPDPSTTVNPGQSNPQAHPGAVIYSDGYRLRAKIHKIASFATLPLFAAEYGLGQSLYKNNNLNSDSKRGIHAAVGTGIVGLFGVNAVTGVWNMVEDRKNPDGHRRRLLHGVLMLTASAGFVATSATGPHEHRNRGITVTSNSQKALHRDLAIGSMGIGTIGYSLMLFGHR